MQGKLKEGERYFREATRLARRGIGKSAPQVPGAQVNLTDDAMIPVLYQGVSERQKLGQQDKVHGLLLQAGKDLSEHGPESQRLVQGCALHAGVLRMAVHSAGECGGGRTFV